MAAHHTYVPAVCPSCNVERIVRKDLLTKKQKAGENLLCRSCAMKTRPTTWCKPPETLRRNQGAYKSYCKAKQRVKTNHKNAYAHVEFRFESYEQFLAELGPRPEGMTLDRIDPNGHYEPSNVRWATVEEQCKNKRSNMLVEYNGIKMCITDAAKAAGIHYGTIERRLNAGCPESHLFMKGRWRYKNGKLADNSQLE